MPTVELLTRDEITERRDALLAKAGMPLDDLRDAADEYRLTPTQAALLDEVEDLEFLLQAG